MDSSEIEIPVLRELFMALYVLVLRDIDEIAQRRRNRMFRAHFAPRGPYTLLRTIRDLEKVRRKNINLSLSLDDNSRLLTGVSLPVAAMERISFWSKVHTMELVFDCWIESKYSP